MNCKKIILYIATVFRITLGFSQNEVYGYDPNGNLISDSNKEILSITYNVLNLPEKILFSDGRKIINTYSADGKKLSQETVLPSGETNSKNEYLDNVVYESDQLSYINTLEGYMEPTVTSSGVERYNYTYQHKDQLGNIRVSYSDTDQDGKIDLIQNHEDADGDGDLAMEIKEEKEYYPFGLQWQHPGAVIRGREHNYGYGGKEEINIFGLDWNDHGARMYDPATARWNGIDQKAEKYHQWSPYNYVADNPIVFNDPDGKELRIHYEENGQQKYYIYKGGKPKDIPNNKFVNQVISAYQYNTKNGGGNFLKTAAFAKETLHIRETGAGLIDQENYKDPSYEFGAYYSHHREIHHGEVLNEARTVYWDPNGGLHTDTGAILSPATILEHETGHWVLRTFFPEIYHSILQKKGGDYTYIYEQIIINSGEQKTAEANGEVKKGQPSRKSHGGKKIRTSGPTTTLPPSFEILEQIMKDIRSNSDKEDSKR